MTGVTMTDHITILEDGHEILMTDVTVTTNTIFLTNKHGGDLIVECGLTRNRWNFVVWSDCLQLASSSWKGLLATEGRSEASAPIRLAFHQENPLEMSINLRMIHNHDVRSLPRILTVKSARRVAAIAEKYDLIAAIKPRIKALNWMPVPDYPKFSDQQIRQIKYSTLAKHFYWNWVFGNTTACRTLFKYLVLGTKREHLKLKQRNGRKSVLGQAGIRNLRHVLWNACERAKSTAVDSANQIIRTINDHYYGTHDATAQWIVCQADGQWLRPCGGGSDFNPREVLGDYGVRLLSPALGHRDPSLRVFLQELVRTATNLQTTLYKENQKTACKLLSQWITKDLESEINAAIDAHYSLPDQMQELLARRAAL